MNRHRLYRALSVGLLVSALGCAAPADDVGTRAEPIVGGELGGIPAAVVIQNYRSGGLCSGSLIAERVVLTAKHCVQDAFADGPVDASAMVVGIGDDVRRLSTVLRVQTIYTTPGQYTTDSRGGVGSDLIGVDVAVMVLQSGAAGVEPLPIRRTSHADLRGQQITAVGYGQTPSGEVGVKYTAMGYVTGTDANLIYVGALTCHGDSGGPAITEEGEVAGVVSFGAGSCGSGYGAYNSIFNYLDMIDEALMEAGSCLNDGEERCDGADNDCDDLVDETCTPIGGDCAADDECVGLTCRDTRAGQICTSPCDPLRPDFGCNPGFYCAFSSGCDGFCVPLDGEAALPVGAPCTEDAECSTLFCVDPGDGDRRCLDACRGDAGMCLAGEACAANPGECGGCVDAEILRAERGLGEGCAADSECRSGDCLLDDGRQYCTVACEADADCGDGFHCRGRICPEGEECPEGNVCIAGPRGDIGDPCIGNGDCAPDTFCARRGDNAWCSRFCDSEECPEGFACVMAGGAQVCAPDRGLLGDDCTSDDDCVTGLCTVPEDEVTGECSRMCGRDAPCAVGFECRRTADGLGAVCVEPVPVAASGGCSASGPAGASMGWGISMALFGLVALWRRRRN